MKDKEEDSNGFASHALLLVNTKKPPRTVKRKKGSSSFVPIGLTPEFDENEVKDSLEDNNLTIAEMMRCCKKRANIETKDCDEDGNPSGHSQSFSSTIADDEDESLLGVRGTFDGAYKDRRELQMVQEEVVIGQSERTVKGANKGNPEHPIHNMLSINGVEGECNCYAVDIPGLTLEARISMLEKLVKELKAMRSTCK
ncbi:hypothetical protein REPUB_Repub04eG0048500 [Reevesia pubescens]